MSLNTQGYLSEIYSAIQGEGPFVGVYQLFIRFSACDLRCIWCDTPLSLTRTKTFSVEKEPGSRIFHTLENPRSVESLLDLIKGIDYSIFHSISLTGGEPLLQSDYILEFLRVLKSILKIPIYLETGGHRPVELEQIIDFVDFISMDFKLPSSAKTAILWDKHEKSLALALKFDRNVWVKIIISDETQFDELLFSINLVKSLSEKFNKKVEIYLQPVSAINNIKPFDESTLLVSIYNKLALIYPYIRILPQVHKSIGFR